ncbi:MAG: DUF1254 domain-containing protein [Proteobacteria bacterium]|nr:DUF1254 domain-containing protein [Pseudomonadota bacterium]
MMKKILAILLINSTLFSSSIAFSQENTSPLVGQMYDGKWPDQKTVTKYIQDAYYQRAITAYFLTLPILNVIGMRDGSESKFGKGYNILPIWKDRMNAKTWVPTPNCDVIYSMNYLNLKETGPLVIYAPPNVIGMFTDFFQHTLTDVGAAGPDKARGGLYLLLPPGYQGHVPAGYFVFRSQTNNVFLFFRTVLQQGKDGPDTREAVATAEQTQIYPLSAIESQRKPMQFPNASNVAVNMMYPTDFSYWMKLKAFVDAEPSDALPSVLRGILASIGIIKDMPFNPPAEQKQLLESAVKTAPQMIFATRIQGRTDKRDLYYSDRQYLNVWAGTDADWYQPAYLDLIQRATYFQVAFSSAPAMVVDTINLGSKYPTALRDKDGDLLDGSHTYKLHLPAHIPAKLYWAITIYNPEDGTMPQTNQAFPSINQFNKPIYNQDGSLDIYFAPNKPSDVDEKNWIQTLPNRAFLATIRLYGTEAAFFNQTWRPDDLIKIN